MPRVTLLLVPALLAVALVAPVSTAPVVTTLATVSSVAPPFTDGEKGPASTRAHPLSDAEVAKASATIDTLVADDLAKAGILANPPIDEYTFLRRAYLSIIGRIPTVDEAQAYLGSGGKDRRAKLIAFLQEQPGRVSHEFTWWADLLRVSTRLGDRYPGNAYVDWVKESVKANKPYDAMVRELITAEGPALARGNGATGYYLRDAGMPLDNMANTVQVFLGTRVQCAMCHDHPFDKWTRKEFYQLGAYTNSVNVGREVKGLGQIRKANEKELSQGVKDALRLLGNTVALSVQGGRKYEIALPHDYQYQDAKPDQKISAKPLFGEVPPIVDGKIAKDQDAKRVYAAWMTDTANPRFATVIANRLWKRAFGVGLIEPVDNFTDETVAANAPLMDYLSKLMVSVDFDIKRFQRTLYETEAWQRAATTIELSASEPYRFPGPVLRRMTAEQLWDSLLTLAVPEIDTRQGQNAERLYEFYEQNKGKDAKELFALAQELGGRREKMRALEQEQRALRAQVDGIANKNSIEARRGKERLKEIGEERDEIARATDAVRMIAFKKPKVGPEQFVRASELPSPAPAGHFLQTFGQSDRDVIEAASTAPAATQALNLLNGFIDKELLKERSVLYQEMLKPKDVGGKVDVLFLACLTRPPSDGERELGKTEIAHALLEFRKSNKAGGSADVAKEAAKAALHNFAWVLLNSNEFLFVE